METIPVDLSKLSNVVNNYFVKKTERNESVTKVNAFVTSGFVLKIQNNTDKSGPEKKINDAEKKIPHTSGTVKKSRL